ncbi:salutaridine reductase [Quercus suber]|uniref:Salutaridine reductase n=1 Tax=Quercus suber TaxID=58331 RepID=A0AAW0JS21_QUESU
MLMRVGEITKEVREIASLDQPKSTKKNLHKEDKSRIKWDSFTRKAREALRPNVNNAGASAVEVDMEGLKALNIDPSSRRIPGEHIRKELSDVETLTEERVKVVIRRFLHDLKENALEGNGWPLTVPAYGMSKVTLNAYTRILAKKFTNMCINCVHPGYVKTDINWNTGTMSVEEGARGPVMLALLPDGGPTGCYFDMVKTTYEKAEECLNTNYYGVRRVTEALLPLLQLSPAGARIVNLSSRWSQLKYVDDVI